jgi:hypothetical protein
MHIIEDRNDANDILHRSQTYGRGIFLLSLIGYHIRKTFIKRFCLSSHAAGR